MWWLLCGAVLEPVAVVAGFQNMAVMREPVEQCRGHLGIPEHTGPLAEAQVGGDHDAGALVEFGQQVEQQGIRKSVWAPTMN